MRITKRMLAVLAGMLLSLMISIPALAATSPITAAETAANKDYVFSYLTNEIGMNNAAACGVMANIEVECKYNPNSWRVNSAGAYVTYGICQWYDGASVKNCTKFMNWCSDNNKDYHLLDSQLGYLRYTLYNGGSYYSSILSYLRSVPNTADGAYDAAYHFCYYYEIPTDKVNVSKSRGNTAKTNLWPEYANKVIPLGNPTNCTHSYVTVKNPATCAGNGSVVNQCYKCHAVKSTKAITRIADIKLKKSSYYYNGKNQKPKVKYVKNANGKTINSKYYKVKYDKNAKSVGIHKVTLTFKDYYTGSCTLYYTIKPKAVSLSSLKKLSCGTKVKWKKGKQITGYQLQYSTGKSFGAEATQTLNITGASNVSQTISQLLPEKKYYFRIRCYRVINDNGTAKTLYSKWSSKKSVKTKA